MACQGMHIAQYCIGSTAAPLQNKYRGQKAVFVAVMRHAAKAVRARDVYL
jgi:hypothetical protein